MERGKLQAAHRGFKHSFSGYVGWLIERDSVGGVEREDPIPGAPTLTTLRVAEEPEKPAKKVLTLKTYYPPGARPAPGAKPPPKPPRRPRKRSKPAGSHPADRS